MEQPVGHESMIGSITRSVRRHVILVLVILLLGVAAAGAYAHTRPVRYTSTATLLPRPLIGNPLGPEVASASGTQLTVAMQTEAGLVDTPRVARIASDSLGTTLPRANDQIVATVPPNTQIVRVTYTSDSAADAQQGAQAFASAFLTYREGVSTAAQRVTLNSLFDQQRLARAALKVALLTVPLNPDPRSYAYQNSILYENQLGTLKNKISAAQSLDTSPGAVVSSAGLPKAADGVKPLVVVVAGGLLALVVALSAAAAMERRRGLVAANQEADLLGVPVLGSLPKIPPGTPQLVYSREPTDGVAEAYRRLRASFIAMSGQLQVLSIPPVSPAGSSAPVVVNLGLSLVQAGYRVVVVAAAGDGACETLLDARPSPGLSDVLTGEADVHAALQSIHGLAFLPAGSVSGQARELYAGPSLRNVTTKLRSEADFVLIASPGTASADADSLALAADGVVVVVTDGVTTHQATKDAAARYSLLNITTVGAVSQSPVDEDEAFGRTAVSPRDTVG